METKHVWVSLVDLPESLNFSVAINEKLNFRDQMSEQEKAQNALFEFIDFLSKDLSEKIYYMGQDVIGEKFFYRFQFAKQGFLEVMNQAPTSIIAHFLDEKKANTFAIALKKNLGKAIKEGHQNTLDILTENIEVSKQNEDGFKVDTHTKMAKIRETIDKF
ncbi:MAG: hypothetical protein Q8P05_02445 [Candidatus Diapherotrites archaeon]|nr:hypothetical protein [Candidatus Diapherotrites archaeon]